MIIAHGSSSQEWIRLVDQAAEQVELDIPVVTVFLELVDGRLIQDGINQLEHEGVSQIIVVPLFVSSGSKHIEEIQYLFGLKKSSFPIDEPPFTLKSDVIFCPPMDAHPLIAQVVLERALAMSQQPEREALVLVGHGSDEGTFYERWVYGVEQLVGQIKEKTSFAEVAYALLKPDQLRRRCEPLSQSYQVLVVPLFLSEGYFTEQVIPSRLEGLRYQYEGKTYLPSKHIAKWIQQSIQVATES